MELRLESRNLYGIVIGVCRPIADVDSLTENKLATAELSLKLWERPYQSSRHLPNPYYRFRLYPDVIELCNWYFKEN